jgi:hypothetical protein
MLKTERNVLYIDVNGIPKGKIPVQHLLKTSESKDGDNGWIKKRYEDKSELEDYIIS